LLLLRLFFGHLLCLLLVPLLDGLFLLLVSHLFGVLLMLVLLPLLKFLSLLGLLSVEPFLLLLVLLVHLFIARAGGRRAFARGNVVRMHWARGVICSFRPGCVVFGARSRNVVVLRTSGFFVARLGAPVGGWMVRRARFFCRHGSSALEFCRPVRSCYRRLSLI